VKIETFCAAEVDFKLLTGLMHCPEFAEHVAAEMPEDHCDLFQNAEQNMVFGWLLGHYRRHRQTAGEEDLTACLQDWASHGPDEFSFGRMNDICGRVALEERTLPSAAGLADLFRKCRENAVLRRFREVKTAQQAERTIESWQALTDSQAKGERFPTFTLNDVLAGPRRSEEYLIENLLAAGQTLAIVGAEKTLKTWMTLNAGVSLTTGIPFLYNSGSCLEPLFPVNRTCNVLIMTGESGKTTICKNLHALYCDTANPFGKQVRLRGVPRLHVSTSLPHLPSKADMRALRLKMESVRAEVLLVDPITKAMDAEQLPNSGAVQNQLGCAAEVCKKLGATFGFNHHAHTLKNPCRPLDLADIAYKGFASDMGQWILMSRQEAYRDPESDDHERRHRIYLRVGGRPGHSGLYGVQINEGSKNRPRWIIEELGRCAGRPENGEAGQLERDKGAVMEALRKQPEGETKDRLQKAARIKDGNRMDAVLRALREEAKVTEAQVQRDNRKTPYPGWKLA
jgi:hypothetical protein